MALFGLLMVAPTVLAQGEQVENPIYRNWADFAEGARVTYRTVTEAADNTTEMSTVYTLIEMTDTKAVIEIIVTIRVNGEETANPAQRFEHARYFMLPPGVNRGNFGKPQGLLEQGAETITVNGTEYEARWRKTKNRVEAGDTFTQSWSSPEVPGGLLRSVSETPATGSVTTIELVDIQLP
jgi:hypothetical protein